jgi:hypothetical protein
MEGAGENLIWVLWIAKARIIGFQGKKKFRVVQIRLWLENTLPLMEQQLLEEITTRSI